MNGGYEKEFDETHHIIPSPKFLYDLKPEMSADEVAKLYCKLLIRKNMIFGRPTMPIQTW